MGYYSDVFIACEKDCTELIEAIMKAEPTYHATENYFFCEFTNCKWYESYPMVKAIMSAINNIEERECEYMGRKYMALPFGYMEIGEEYDDITELGRPYDFGIRLIRNMEWD